MVYAADTAKMVAEMVLWAAVIAAIPLMAWGIFLFFLYADISLLINLSVIMTALGALFGPIWALADYSERAQEEQLRAKPNYCAFKRDFLPGKHTCPGRCMYPNHATKKMHVCKFFYQDDPQITNQMIEAGKMTAVQRIRQEQAYSNIYGKPVPLPPPPPAQGWGKQ